MCRGRERGRKVDDEGISSLLHTVQAATCETPTIWLNFLIPPSREEEPTSSNFSLIRILQICF